MTKNPLISIIVIDYKIDNPLLIECLSAIQKQTYKNFEILLVTDYPVKLPARLTAKLLAGSLRVYSRGNLSNLTKKSFGHYVGPAEKRDWGGEHAKGEILAFIDDDAYPDKNWLKNMVKNFSNKDVSGVGGPGVTPPGVSWQEAASGWMSASPMGAGPYTYRFLPAKKQFVDDYPSMNLAVRRSDFLAVDGYDSHYWPGEDTKLCLDLVAKLNKKIIYDPQVLVYHHRRPLWQPHLKQNGNFGLHRGFFARVLPQTSLRPVYLAPSLMLLGLLYLIFISPFTLYLSPYTFHLIPFTLYLIPYTLITNIGYLLFALYLCAIVINSIWIYKKSKSLFQGVLSFFVVFITHLWYGFRFLQGFFFTKKLTR